MPNTSITRQSMTGGIALKYVALHELRRKG